MQQNNISGQGMDWKSVMLVAATIFMMLSLIVIVTQPDINMQSIRDSITDGFTGFAIFDGRETHSIDISKTYTEDSIEDIAIDMDITSIRLNGKYIGEFKIWLDNGTEKILLAESSDDHASTGNLLTGLEIFEWDEDAPEHSSEEFTHAENFITGMEIADVSSEDDSSSDDGNDEVDSGDSSSNDGGEGLEDDSDDSEGSSSTSTDPFSEYVLEDEEHLEPEPEEIDNQDADEVINDEIIDAGLDDSESEEMQEEDMHDALDPITSAERENENASELIYIENESNTDSEEINISEELPEPTEKHYMLLRNECSDACNILMDLSNAKLIIEVSNGSEVLIDDIEYTVKKIDPVVEMPSDIIINDTENNTMTEITANATANITEDIENITFNESLWTNYTNITVFNETEITIDTTQFEAHVGEPVKWVTTVTADAEIAGITIDIPVEASSIIVRELDEDGDVSGELYVHSDSSNAEYDSVTILENSQPVEDAENIAASSKPSSDEPAIDAIWPEEISEQSGEQSVPDEQAGQPAVSVSIDVVETADDANTTIIINESLESIEIEYYTQAPMMSETMVNDTVKEVQIYSDIHYTDVLAVAQLPQEVGGREDVLLRWKIYESEDSPEDGFTYEEMEFNIYDTNGNSLYDTVEWIAPHLSNQTFIIIVITQAMLLDENRTIIEDIYERVAHIDNMSATAMDGQYVRVKFEKELQSHNDITLYAHAENSSGSQQEGQSSTANVEVYEKDQSTILSTFTNISSYGKYRILLDNLTVPQDTFDLKIVGAGVTIDQVIDPSANLSFIVYRCGDITSPGLYTMNQSIVPGGAASTRCINITVPNVMLNCNFTRILNATWQGTAIYTNASNTTITNCNITLSQAVGVGGIGIMFNRSNNSAIINNNISALFSIGNSTAFNLNISGNVFSSMRSSIAYLSGGNINITNNVMNGTLSNTIMLNGTNIMMHNNTITRGNIGIHINTQGSNNISGNTISTAINGIVINRSDNNTVLNNTISSATNYGIRLQNATVNIVQHNNITASTSYPVFVEAFNDTHCDNNITNTTTNNRIQYFYYYNYTVSMSNVFANYSIQLCDADNSVLSNITLRNQTATRNGGIILTRTQNTSLSNITTYGRYTGIRLTINSTNNTITNLLANYSSAGGLQIDTISSNNIISNTMAINGINGINISAGNNTFTNITSTNNTQSGIFIGSTDNIISNATSNANVLHGIHITAGKNSLSNLSVYNNVFFGLYVLSQSNNFTDIYLSNNRRAGILIDRISIMPVNNTFRNFNLYNNSNTSIRYADIYINRSANRTTFLNGFINTSTNHSVFINNISYDVLFSDIFITGNYTNGFVMLRNSNVTLLNVSVNTSKENISSSGINFNNTLTRRWRYTAYANYSNGSPLGGINISARFPNGTVAFNITTALNGYAYGNITEYINTGNNVSRTFFNNHTFNATNGTIFMVKTHNLTEDNNTFDVFTFDAPGGDAPTTIYPVINITSSPIEGTIMNVSFNFSASGASSDDINISSAKIVINISGVSRESDDDICTGFAINATTVNISCNVSVKYYDPPGVWEINASVYDEDSVYVENLDSLFTYNTLYAVSLNTNLLDAGTINAGMTSNYAGQIIINNTGNFNYTTVQLLAFDLFNSTSNITASNFRVNVSNVSTGRSLSNNSFITVLNARLNRTTDTLSGNQSLYLYVDVPNGTPSRRYTTISDWIVSLS